MILHYLSIIELFLRELKNYLILVHNEIYCIVIDDKYWAQLTNYFKQSRTTIMNTEKMKLISSLLTYSIYVFQNRIGVCGAWSYDTFEETCYLHTAYSCCGQFDKREEDSNFISGYTCNKCWSTRNECPCGRRNPLPYDPEPSEPSTPAVKRQGQALYLDNRLFEVF